MKKVNNLIFKVRASKNVTCPMNRDGYFLYSVFAELGMTPKLGRIFLGGLEYVPCT